MVGVVSNARFRLWLVVCDAERRGDVAAHRFVDYFASVSRRLGTRSQPRGPCARHRCAIHRHTVVRYLCPGLRKQAPNAL